MLYTKEYHHDLEKNAGFISDILHDLGTATILVTGAGGLIGSATVDLLCCAKKLYNRELSIYAAGRDLDRLRDRFSDWPDLSYLQYDALKPMETDVVFDYVIHCASNANPAKYMEEPVETMRINFDGMYHILEYARGKKCRILYVSSSEVYGNRDGQKNLFDETGYYSVDILNSRACYPSSKRAAETLCKAYIDEYKADVVIVRPGHVYGAMMKANDNRASSQFIRDVIHHKDIVMKSAGQQLRSYCYVMDCVTAMLTVMGIGKTGEAYNISNVDSVATIREFAEELALQSGRKVIFENASDEEKKGYNLMDISALNAEKLEALGWRGHYNLQDGIRSVLKSVRLE
jgi:nucleoside-diphosphate-sugar epimerase